MSSTYEFTESQNDDINRLSRRMSGVGAVFAIVGFLGILTALATVAVIYKAEIPPTVFDNVPEDVRQDVADRVASLPGNTQQLWAVVANTGTAGLIYFLIGIWTRSAGRAFRKIVKTENSDIEHLMNGLGSLSKMYSLIYKILLFAMLLLVGGLGYFLYLQFGVAVA